MQDIVKEFEKPGCAYRGKPFWAWNGKLEEAELRRQIRVMHGMGLGGFFMHSRVGLATPYLSDEWFGLVNACVDEAEKLDMEAWLYDEDRWPSGAAGGLVTKNPKYRLRYLAMRQLKDPKELKWDENVLAVFTARVNGLAATEVKRLRRGRHPSELPEGVTLLVFDVRVQDLSSWYNGYTYLDTLSHAAVRQFMKVTHEAYRQHCGKAFGKRVPGIFTDEPNYLPHNCRIPGGSIAPWTDKLPETFLKRYGYDLIPRLPEVFFDVDGKPITPTRHDFYDCVTHLFVEAFGRQIGEWCKKNRMLHTGHLLMEDTLSAQTSVVGNCMRFYEYMQAPGIDLLTETRRIYDTAKQVSSAARQFGWKWRLTETYGVTRWDFPFTGHKALGDWQAALGMNLRCHHLSWYTAAGEAKRDYPASMNYQSPWWEVYAHVEDYYARLNVLLSRGQEVRDLLVVHPIESLWTLFRRDMGPNPEMQAYDQMLPRLRDELLWQHIDFDYGDEELLSRHGKAQRKGGKPVLRMAKAEYRAVLVPPLRTIRRTTLDLLTKFAKLGGKVVFAGDPPKHVDCRPSDDAVHFAAQCVRTPAQGREMADAVAAECRRVSILDEKDAPIEAALYQLREDVDVFYLFICNTGMTAEQLRQNSLVNPPVAELKAEFPTVRVYGFAECEGAPQEWDALEGKRYAAVTRRLDSGQWEIQTSLPRLGSRLFVIPKRPAVGSLASRQWEAQTSPRRLGSRLPVTPKKPVVESLPSRPVLNEVRREALNPPLWPVALSEANVLVLDRPAYRIQPSQPLRRSGLGDGAWQLETEILRVDDAVRESLGIARRGGQMVQPWARARNPNPKSVPVELRYAFNVAVVPSGDLCFAVERPERFRVAVNGTPIKTDNDCGWWTDLSVRRLPVDPALLKVGRNEISLTCAYDEDHGFEAAYLLGSFGVELEGLDATLIPPVTELSIGDWVAQGLPFYAGNVSYLAQVQPNLNAGERLLVEIPEYDGVAVQVWVNGQRAGAIAWPPNEVDITGFAQGDVLDLRIQVIGHRRNSHGPLHLNAPRHTGIGPGHFKTRDKQWQDDYRLVPCGLLSAPWLVVRRPG